MPAEAGIQGLVRAVVAWPPFVGVTHREVVPIRNLWDGALT
jgi:hypothetical protein